MTLERRLALAVAALVLTVAVAGGVVYASQRTYLLDRLDAQVAALASRPQAALALAERGSAARRVLTAYSEVWIGTVSGDGRVETVLAPASDPQLRPRLAAGDALAIPVERATDAGTAGRVRVVTARLRDGRLLAVATPTTPVDAALNRLALTLTLAGFSVLGVAAVIVFWVRRLGLAPIRSMTGAAVAIRAGRRAERIPPAPAGSEAARLGDALNAMLDATRESESRLRQFVADASHELRTPLTTLRGYADLHADGGGDPVIADAMRRIRSEAARMHRLVEELLTLTALDATSLRVSAVAFHRLLGDVADDLRVAQPGRRVEVSCPPDVTLTADPDRLLQAVMALGANALRHTPLQAEVRLLAGRGSNNEVRIEVCDDGPGIPSAERERVWERFARGSSGRSGGGSGLGLAIVAAIVRAHGGTYAVTAPPEGGTRVVLVFPDRTPT